MRPRFTILLATLAATGAAEAADLRVAVAANFADAAAEIARAFEARQGQRVVLVPGSTGKLHAQIDLGAPFDVLLAADADSPRRLESQGRAVPGSRFTYAVGRLALWSARDGLVDAEGAVLAGDRYRRLAIANPQTAPYGRAAMQVLERLGLLERVAPLLVRGESVGQVYHFVASGAAELGFLALSQLRPDRGTVAGSAWIVPETLHESIEQQAVLLVRAKDNPAAAAFLAFLREPEARAIVARLGYR